MRRHNGAPVNTLNEIVDTITRQCVDPQPQNQTENKPANGLYPAQIGMRPSHTAQGIKHQRQWQVHEGMPAQGFKAMPLLPEKKQARAHYSKRHHNGLEGVLQHHFGGRANAWH